MLHNVCRIFAGISRGKLHCRIQCHIRFQKVTKSNLELRKFADLIYYLVVLNDVCREPSPLFTEARWIVHPSSVLQKSIMRNWDGRGSVWERQRILVWYVEEKGMKKIAAWLENGDRCWMLALLFLCASLRTHGHFEKIKYESQNWRNACWGGCAGI